jgi:hypothetical protein
LARDHGLPPVEDPAPASVPDRRRRGGRYDDVDEQHRRQHALTDVRRSGPPAPIPTSVARSTPAASGGVHHGDDVIGPLWGGR